MVRFKKEKVIIEIEDPTPKEFVKYLKIALIRMLQDRDMNEVTNMINLKETNYIVLELLRNLEE